MIIVNHEFKINFKQLLIWSIVIGLVVYGLILIYPEWSAGMGDMSQMLEKMGSFSKAFGFSKINMNTATGYYSIESGTMIAIGGAMFSALLGTGILAKEEANHTAEFLLTTPNSRHLIITQKLLALTLIIIAFNAFVILTALLGFVTIGESVTTSFFLYHLALLIMQLEIGYLCFGISAFLKRSSYGLGIAIALLLYFLNILANMSDELTFLTYITPFYYSDGANIFSSNSVEFEYVGIGVVASIFSIFLAYWKYTTKDIAN